MTSPEPFEDVRRARDEARIERDILAVALAAVLNLADRWGATPYLTLTPRSAAEQLRAVVAAPVTAAPGDVAARLEAYQHLARLRAEVEAAQRTAEPLTVAQAAREVARTFGGWDPDSAAFSSHNVTAAAFERFANLLEGK